MATSVHSSDVSFEAESEVGMPTTPRRWCATPTPTQSDIIRKRVLTYNNSKPTHKMVIEAIRLIGSRDEKGASVAAITKWIVGNYAILDMERVKVFIKKAILKALEQGTIQRSETSKGALGANGSFVLGSKKKSRTVEKKSKKSAKSLPANHKDTPKKA